MKAKIIAYKKFGIWYLIFYQNETAHDTKNQ